MGEIFLAAVVLGALYLLFHYIIIPVFRDFVFPVGRIVLIVIAIGIVVYALGVAVYCFASAIRRHRNPYEDDGSPYRYRGSGAANKARRGYFFGPGLYQLRMIARDSFTGVSDCCGRVWEWRQDVTLTMAWYFNIPITVACVVLIILTYVFGGVLVLAFSAMLFSILLTGMIVFFVFFGLLWILDRLYLLAFRISTRCPICTSTKLVPKYRCSQCRTLHANLTPGTYGVFHRTCSCGKRLPTTIFNGRAKLQACCYFCERPLIASDAKQIGIQLIGTTNAGKTTFTASFLHGYVSAVKRIPNVTNVYHPESEFRKLEQAYLRGARLDTTTEKSAVMYSVLHKGKRRSQLQLSIYDVAGEAFQELEHQQQQQQFEYCEGMAFFIDLEEKQQKAIDCLFSFTSYFRSMTGLKNNQKIKKNVSVILSKADHSARLLSAIQDPPETRDRTCRDYLMRNGYAQLLKALDAEFASIAFFPVSATGGTPVSGRAYQPRGVMPPILHLLLQTNKWTRQRWHAALEEIVKNL